MSVPVRLTGETMTDFEMHYEVTPAYAETPTMIALLRVWDTRQER
jgi:hypothetical protein